MSDSFAEGMWKFEADQAGPCVAISFGAHGNERAPIDAGLRLVEEFEKGGLRLGRGRLLLIHANPRATLENLRWSEGGKDLNRCFHAAVLAREPRLYEEQRAHEIVAALTAHEAEVLVDFHCTVEDGRRFLMQHPPGNSASYRPVYELLRAEVLLADPQMNFGGVSLDEWMAVRDRVGICYETGWIKDPDNNPEAVRQEMLNLLRGLALLEDQEAVRWPAKILLELAEVVTCEGEGFRWQDGVGANLQALDASVSLGVYADGREVKLPGPRTLIFPKKRPELLQPGQPLVYLAARSG